MKRDFLFFLILLVCTTGATAWGACPADTLDPGVCDSIYFEPWPADVADTVWERPGPYFVRVPIYVTNDVPDPNDSIYAFVVPLCITHSNPAKYCSVTSYWNEILWGSSRLPRSIFRHLPDNATATVHNWMMDQFEVENGDEWDQIILNLDGTSHFWLTVIPGGSDPAFPAGSRILLATMTLKLQDTMHVCLDSCFWPPSARLTYTRKDSQNFVPRLGNTQTVPNDYTVCLRAAPSDVREIEGSDMNMPTEFSLSQNYPNPFNPVTNFQFTILKSTHVKIELFNIVGQKVRMLVDEDMKPGVYSADWNGKDENGNSVSSGIYFYRMQAGDFANTKKMVLMK